MAVTDEVLNYGTQNAAANANAFAFRVGYDLSSAHTFECYDNNNTYPAIHAGNFTHIHEIFVGTTNNGSRSMIHLVDTGGGAPTLPVWKVLTETAGGAVQVNRMEGQVSYVTASTTLTGGTPADYTVAQHIGQFNMLIEVPHDAATSDDMAFDLLVRYTYTGANDPAPVFSYNDASTGTEGTPVWTNITIGTEGVKHCRAGSDVDTAYANIPANDFVQGTIYNATTVAGIDDCTAGGQFSDTVAAKYEIEIDATGTPDTFRWRKTPFDTGTPSSWTSTVNVATSATTIDAGVTVTFGATTGHNTSDVWIIYAGIEDTVEGWITTS